MFDGAAVATVSTVSTEQIAQSQADASLSNHDSATADSAPAAPTGEPQPTAGDQALFDALAAYDTSAARQEIVFLSPSVLDYQKLLDGISPNVEVHILDPTRDGVAQMAEILAGRTGIDSIHLIGDGTEAEMHLGASFLTQESISTTYAEQFQQIGQSLSADADLLIYGCNFGRGEAGKLAMNALADLTGADVAASTDRTGSAAEYADWQLEATTGSIETSVVIRESTQADWDHALATFTVLNTNNAGANSLRTAINNANAAAGTDTIVFNIPGAGVQTINLTSNLPTITGNVLIDGWSQPGFAGTPVIRIDGGDARTTGLSFTGTSDGSTVRGLMITNFTGDGILIQAGADNITIRGNWIGTTGTGSIGMGNGDDGIDIRGSLAVIGGTGVNDRNVITNSGDEGIDIVGAGVTGHLIQGNYIGLDPDGSTGGGNVDVGIAIVTGTGNTIGGTTAAARNVISRNAEGIEIRTNNNIVQGNYIGTDSTGTLNRGNQSSDGIEIPVAATGNLIGGAAAGAGNLIAFNAANGVDLVNGTGNAVLGNLIYSNTLLGLNLGAAGVTANDAGDPDAGANNLQNFPVLTSVNSNTAGTTIVGTLNSNANITYRIEFFANRPSVADATNGEGERYLGFITVTTNGAGNAAINTTLNNVWVNAGDRITATATVDLGGGTYGNSSEFGANFTATSTGIVIVDTVSDVADGTTTSITNLGNARGADGRISLREAILATNNTAGTDTIVFNIAGVGPRTINVLSALPAITGTVILDATTQPGFVGTPLIELNGTGAGAGVDGLTLSANGNTIRGLIINRFSNNGIQIDSSNNLIVGNWIGLDNTGTLDLGNAADGITISANNNTIGGVTAADRNVLSGNNDEGVDVDAGFTGVLIQGNYIGTNAAGTAAVPNADVGDPDSGGARLDGDGTVFQGNLVSGNLNWGVYVGGAGNALYGNLIGTNAAGTAAIANSGSGIRIVGGGDNHIIGGIIAGQGNTIAYNTGNGIQIENAGSTGNSILGNSIFTNTGLGIDLANNGVTANDAGDGDAGANSLMNFPVIYGVVIVGGNVTITGEARPGATVEFFESPDAAGVNGEGQTFIGRGTVSGSTAGTVDATARQFSFTFAVGTLVIGDRVTAAATDPTNNTSEFCLNVAAVANSAPVLDATRSPVLTTINEDAGAPVGAVGTLITSVVDFAVPAGQVDNVTDVDSGALLGLAVTAADTTNGTWFYSTNNGASWNALGAVSGANARLLAADANTRLYFQPNANYNGTIANAITFRAWDRASGANGGLADTSINGGTTAFSTATDTASLTVNPVNDAPTITALADQTIAEDGTTGALPFTVSDVETAAGALTVTAVSSNPALIPNGNLTLVNLGGGSWTIAATPALNQNGGPVTITVTVSDGTTTTNETFDVTVTAVNDAPGLVANTGSSVARGGTDFITAAELQVTDVDSTPAQLIYTVTVGPVNGQLELTIAPGLAINSFTQAQIDAGQIVYVHNGSFTLSDSFIFTVSDGAGGSIGAITFGITVTPVNSAPSLAINTGSTVIQGLIDLITSGELQVTDVDNTPAQLIYTVTTAPVNGRLELTTAPGVTITSFTQADINAGRLVFVHNGAVSASDSFTFTVSDGAGGAIGATTFTFAVTPFFPPPPPPPPPPGPGPGPGPGPAPGAPGPIPGGVTPPVLPPPPVLVTVPGATEDSVRRVAMPSRTFARLEQPNIVAEEPVDLPLEPLSLPVKKMLAMGHKLAEHLTRLGDDLDRVVQEREYQAHLLGRVATFSGIALSAGFVAWLLHGGSLLTSFLVSMPAWRRFDPLPVLGSGGKDRRERDHKMREEGEQEKRQFRGLDRVLDKSAKPVTQQETGRVRRPKS